MFCWFNRSLLWERREGIAERSVRRFIQREGESTGVKMNICWQDQDLLIHFHSFSDPSIQTHNVHIWSISYVDNGFDLITECLVPLSAIATFDPACTIIPPPHSPSHDLGEVVTSDSGPKKRACVCVGAAGPQLNRGCPWIEIKSTLAAPRGAILLTNTSFAQWWR